MFVLLIMFSRNLQVRSENGALATFISLPGCRNEFHKMRARRRDPTEVDSKGREPYGNGVPAVV